MDRSAVVAHRGGGGVWAENTEAAFTAAASLGCDLETDVRVTSDGVPVCFHDETLDRVTDSRGPVTAIAYAALRQVRVDDVHPIPTVAELLTGFPDTRIVLDIKDVAAIPALAALITDLSATDRVCVTGCWDNALLFMRSLVGPHLECGLGWRALGSLTLGVPRPGRPGRPGRTEVAGFGDRTWAFLPVFAASRRVVARAHQRGLRVAVWTVDDPAVAERFASWGVEAIITDRPDRLAGHPAVLDRTAS